MGGVPHFSTIRQILSGLWLMMYIIKLNGFYVIGINIIKALASDALIFFLPKFHFLEF